MSTTQTTATAARRVSITTLLDGSAKPYIVKIDGEPVARFADRKRAEFAVTDLRVAGVAMATAESLIQESQAHDTIARADWTPALHAALVSIATDWTDANDVYDYWEADDADCAAMLWRVELRKPTAE